MKPHVHSTHPELIKRLKRASGHLNKVIQMIESDQPCLAIAQQVHAVEKAINHSKKILIHDHIDHCLAHVLHDESPSEHTIGEFKEITKYL